MKIEIEIEYPFTSEEYESLTTEQRQTVEAVAEYLSGDRGLKQDSTDEEISGIFNLLKPCEGCVPSEEAGENLLNTLRKKFGAVHEVGLELAEAELKRKKI